MAANKELDAKTRQVELMRGGPGEDMAVYQAAQNQLLAIQAEQRQNLGAARQATAATMQENGMISQVSGLVGGGSGGAKQVPVNAPTQQVLGKFGMGPKISKSTQKSNQTVTKQNVTINNYNTTNNTTTNNVSGGGGGPTQGRPIMMKQQDDSGKFKVWVNNVIARQNEQATIRDREYQRRESALSRSANKMTKKLEAISTRISKSLDPNRTQSTFMEQLGSLLKIIGIGVIVANFPKIVEFMKNVELKIRYFLDYIGITGGDERKESGEETGLVKDLKYILLGDRADEFKGGFLEAIKEFFLGEGGVIPTIKESFNLWLEERSKAVKAVKKPDFSWTDGPFDRLGGYLDYIGNVLMAFFQGAEGGVKAAAKTASEEGVAEMTTDRDSTHRDSGLRTVEGHHQISYGDLAGFSYDPDTANQKYKLSSRDTDKNGELSNNTVASLRQSNYLADNLSTGKATGAINVYGIMKGLERLENTAEKEDFTLVDPSLIAALKNLGVNIGNLDLEEKKREYGFVVTEKTDAEKQADFVDAHNSNAGQITKGAIAGTTAGIMGAAGAAASGGTAAAVMSVAGAKVGMDLADNLIRSFGTENYTHRLVPKGMYKDSEYSNVTVDSKGTKQKFFTYYALDQADFAEIRKQLAELTGRGNGFSYETSDIESTRLLAKLIQKKTKREQSESFNANMTKLLEEFDKKAEYNQAQKDVWSKSVLNGMGSRVADVGRVYKHNLTTGYFDSDDDDEQIDTETIEEIRKNNGGGKYKKFDVGAAIKVVKNNVTKVAKEVTGKKDVSTGKVRTFYPGEKKKSNQSLGLCYKYVSAAVDTGLGNSTRLEDPTGQRTAFRGTQPFAKDSGNHLMAAGFERISKDEEPKPGDVRVYQAGPGKNDKYGHIEIFDGTNWYSDFKQVHSAANWRTGNSPKYSGWTAYRFGGVESEGEEGAGGEPGLEEGVVESNSSSTNIVDTNVPASDVVSCPVVTPSIDVQTSPGWSEESIVIPNIRGTVGISTTSTNIFQETALKLLDQMNAELRNISISTMAGAEATATNVDATMSIPAYLKNLMASASNPGKPSISSQTSQPTGNV